jgi:hypothetical protein
MELDWEAVYIDMGGFSVEKLFKVPCYPATLPFKVRRRARGHSAYLRLVEPLTWLGQPCSRSGLHQAVNVAYL